MFADRVQTACRPRDTKYPGLEPAHPHLVTHVGLLPRIRRVVQAHHAYVARRGNAHRRIGEGLHEMLHGSLIDAHRGVRVDDDFAGDVEPGGVLSCSLSEPPWPAEQLDATRGEAAHD